VAHESERTVSVCIVGALGARVSVDIRRPNGTRSYDRPGRQSLQRVNELMEKVIKCGSYDFELDIFENSMWITVYGL
jgi:hypothetical protein